jgi:hypothetical protein
MIRGKCHYRKPDPLLLLAAAVVLGVVMTTAAIAGEAISFFPQTNTIYQASPQDKGGYALASIGHAGGGLSVTLTPPRELQQTSLASGGSAEEMGKLTDIFFVLHFPW